MQFGVNVNAAADICEFGTPATGSPVYTTTIATLQANAAWTTGWAAETISSNRPFLEDMNAVCYVFSYMLAYIMEMGIPEYDAGTTYYTNSIVQYSGTIYQSLTDNNTGNTPVVGANWKLAIPAISGILGAWTTKASGTIYQAGTDGFVTVVIGVGSTTTIYGYTDSSSSPSTLRAAQQVPWFSGTAYGSLGFPVRKNDYYQTAGGGTVYFIPIGS